MGFGDPSSYAKVWSSSIHGARQERLFGGGSILESVPAGSWYELVGDIRQLFLCLKRCNPAGLPMAQFVFSSIG